MAPVEELEKEANDEEKEDDDIDTPPVKEMKEIDDQYLKIEREFEKAVRDLRKTYNDRQKPLLEQRAKILQGDEPAAAGAKTGTPAVKGFWLEALSNHPAFDGAIEEWDTPVLEYMSDITQVPLDPDDSQKGFRIRFHFATNPYFENAVLSKEYHTKEKSPYTGEITPTEITASEIKWKAGKDVTVEVVRKKVKGGGAKKAQQKQKGGKEEPRSSFFRIFFKNLKEDGQLPDDLDLERMGMDEDDADEEQMMEMIMDNDHDLGCAIRDNIIPFAVRWYTGEAAPEMDDDDDEDEEEEDPEDDDDEADDEDDSEEEDEPPRRGKKGDKGDKGGKKKGGGGGGGSSAKPAAGAAGGEAPKQEECKQQ